MSVPTTDPSRLEALRQLVPEAFIGGALDLHALAQAVGAPDDAYGLTWPGRAAAAVAADAPATGSLVADTGSSRDAARTGHALVVGDNLDVLRHLAGPYANAVKLIYIDPPYNTGDDRVYGDDATETISAYRARTGAADLSGRFHAQWLSMMYPRLVLAKRLLRRDGLFVASIGVEELGTLRLLCDEVFGEDNLVSVASWRRRNNQPNDRSGIIAQVAEFVLVYAADRAHLRSELRAGRTPVSGLPLGPKARAAYRNPNNDPRGPWRTKPWKAGSGQGGSRYTITAPDGRELTETWMGSQDTYLELLADDRIHWGSDGAGVPNKKIFLADRDQVGAAPNNFWGYDEWGSNQEATAELAALFDGTKQVFENPKPVRLLQRIIRLATGPDDVIVDFFAGSGTTAHATWAQNAADGGHRKVLLVQAPEAVAADHVARTRFGHTTIDEITADRLRRAADTLPGTDCGLAVYRTSDEAGSTGLDDLTRRQLG